MSSKKTKKDIFGMEQFVPFIYIDSNVILNIINGHHAPSAYLIETIKEKKWRCATSHFALMEVLDVYKDNRFVSEKLEEGWTFKKILRKRDEKNLSDRSLKIIYDLIKNKFFIPYKFVQFFWLTEEGIDIAIKICKESNISAADSIHVATAMATGCDILVTSDVSLSKRAKKYMVSCPPEETIEKLKEIGFVV